MPFNLNKKEIKLKKIVESSRRKLSKTEVTKKESFGECYIFKSKSGSESFFIHSSNQPILILPKYKFNIGLLLI